MGGRSSHASARSSRRSQREAADLNLILNIGHVRMPLIGDEECRSVYPYLNHCMQLNYQPGAPQSVHIA